MFSLYTNLYQWGNKAVSA